MPDSLVNRPPPRSRTISPRMRASQRETKPEAFSSASSRAKSGTSFSTSGLHAIGHLVHILHVGQTAKSARPSRTLPPSALFQHAQNLVLFEDQVLFSIELYFGAGVLAEQDAVAGFDFGRHALAGLQQFAAAHGLHFSLLRLFFGGVWNDDAPALGFALFQALDHDAVVQRT